MHGFAPFTVSTFRAVHAGFEREEDAAIDGLLDLPGKEDKTVEIVLIPERIELVACGCFVLGEDVEPE